MPARRLKKNGAPFADPRKGRPVVPRQTLPFLNAARAHMPHDRPASSERADLPVLDFDLCRKADVLTRRADHDLIDAVRDDPLVLRG